MIGKILSISRPRFWLYLLGPYLVGFAAGADTGAQYLSPVFLYGLFFFLLPANIFLYGVNDFFDTDTDIHNVKKGTKENLMMESDRDYYKNATLIAFLFSIPLFIFLNPLPRYILILFFLLAFFYSALPIRFKAKPLLDFVSNILYILPGVIFYMQISKEVVPVLVLVAAGCWTGAMHLYSAIPDIEADKKVRLVTTAVLLGKQNSIILCMVLWSITAFVASGFTPLLVLTWLYPFLTALVYSKMISLEKLYWYFPSINAFLGFILFWYVALN